jgi:MinD superfamily P-loop ATPase
MSDKQAIRQLLVISGKGGTGKTTVVASFAALARAAVLADCDVDAADLHLILKPQVLGQHEFSGGQEAVVIADRCTACGICVENCRFDAIEMDDVARVDRLGCEGCGLCRRLCPEGAIELRPAHSGDWFVSRTEYGTMVHAQLGIAQENSGKLVARVREEAYRRARDEEKPLVLIDGPPGIGCPVIAALSGVDLALLVIEPTMSGIHDFERVLSVCRHFGVQALVCINRYDLSAKNTARVEDYCAQQGVPVIGKIPFDRAVVAALVAGRPAVYDDGPAARAIKQVWRGLERHMYDRGSAG